MESENGEFHFELIDEPLEKLIVTKITNESLVDIKEPLRPFSGLMEKEGRIVKNWKTRYFYLDRAILRYYKSMSDSSNLREKHIDEINLRGCRLMFCNESSLTMTLVIPMTSSDRYLNLRCFDKEQWHQWALAFYDHLSFINGAS